jgi:hypothetical protein
VTYFKALPAQLTAAPVVPGTVTPAVPPATPPATQTAAAPAGGTP